MSTGWIEAVMQMNANIVAAETRFHGQVAHLVATAKRGQDTMQEEALLASYRNSLDLLRTIQTRLLQNTTVTP
ncbi:hypothetical protein G3T14_23630 [Methylobacterium sp. BTF04]|uniref:hypothetical protein n=1 Tax=Methylobacterium sp. BTF04 TaxID=2708300 RepID=UPI0013D2DF1B|nr:hypothetical protein [Methylobacterium sp. BTF04]NEU15036.1 hypothetical protein [Methylobacterium sp. BTF04]